MTYSAGNNIQAIADYNTFATEIDAIFSNPYPGSTTLPNAGFGYGQPAVGSVSVGSNVTAAQWSALFNAVNNAGIHQGTSVSPIPTSVVANTNIAAFPTLPTVLSTLTANRNNLAAGQSALNTVGPFTSGSWTHSLTYTFSVNFGSWDNARFFFNSGGSIAITGAHPNGLGDDKEWHDMLASMSPLAVKYNSTTPGTGSPGPIGGFWNPSTNNPLTISFQTLYTQTYTGPYYYSGSYINVNAKLGANAGAAGSEVLTFQVYLSQADHTPDAKTGTQFSITEVHSVGAVPYPGTAIITNLGFVAT